MALAPTMQGEGDVPLLARGSRPKVQKGLDHDRQQFTLTVSIDRDATDVFVEFAKPIDQPRPKRIPRAFISSGARNLEGSHWRRRQDCISRRAISAVGVSAVFIELSTVH